MITEIDITREFNDAYKIVTLQEKLEIAIKALSCILKKMIGKIVLLTTLLLCSVLKGAFIQTDT